MEQMRHWRAFRRLALFQLPTPQMQVRLLQACTAIHNHYMQQLTPYIISCEGSILGQDSRSQGFTFMLTTRFASIQAMNIFEQDCAMYKKLLNLVASWGVPPPLVVYGEEEWLPPIGLPRVPYSGNLHVGGGRGVGTVSAPLPGSVNGSLWGNLNPGDGGGASTFPPPQPGSVNMPPAGNAGPLDVPPAGNAGPLDVPLFSNFDITGGHSASTRPLNNPSPGNVGPLNEPSPGHVGPLNNPLPSNIGSLDMPSFDVFDIAGGGGDSTLQLFNVGPLNEPSSGNAGRPNEPSPGNLNVAGGRGPSTSRSPFSGGQNVPAPSFNTVGRRLGVTFPPPYPRTPSGSSPGNFDAGGGRGTDVGAGPITGTAVGPSTGTAIGPSAGTAIGPSAGTGAGPSTPLGGGRGANPRGGSSSSSKRRRTAKSGNEELEEDN